MINTAHMTIIILLARDLKNLQPRETKNPRIVPTTIDPIISISGTTKISTAETAPFPAKALDNANKTANAIKATASSNATTGINVETGIVDDSDSQVWEFYMQPDNSYKIVNKQFGKCLDLCGGTTDNKANIQLFEDNGQDSQRWYIKECGDSVKLIPKCATMNALDVQGGLLTPGTNVFSFVENNSVAQLLSIESEQDDSQTEKGDDSL